MHWTPIPIVEETVAWFNKMKATRILDIGSGVGKFCLRAATLSKAHFTGVEFRDNLHQVAQNIKADLKLENVDFILSNITEVEFKGFDAIFYYNPFCEQNATSDLIDNHITISPQVLKNYESHVFTQLDIMPKGTLLVTYRSDSFQPPSSFHAQNILHNGNLVFWKKLN